MSGRETDQVFGQVEGFILASDSSPDLADIVPRQAAMLAYSDLSNRSVTKPALTRNASIMARGPPAHTDIDNSATPYEGHSAERERDETATSLIRNHATPEPEEPIEPALEPNTTPSPAHATLATGALEPRACIEVPKMLSRFLRVDRENDPLRYEASIAISEGRVQHGEDIVRRKILEEDWQWNITLLSTATNTSWG